jgi:hypothetical protein
MLILVILFHSLDPAQEESELEAKWIQPKMLTPSPSPSKASPDALHSMLEFYFWINIFMLRMIVH